MKTTGLWIHVGLLLTIGGANVSACDTSVEPSKELAIVGACFDIGAYGMEIDPSASADFHQFLAIAKQKFKERADKNLKTDLFEKLDLSNNRVVVNGKEFRLRLAGTEHDSKQDGSTALIRHYKIFSPTFDESLSRRVQSLFPGGRKAKQ